MLFFILTMITLMNGQKLFTIYFLGHVKLSRRLISVVNNGHYWAV